MNDFTSPAKNGIVENSLRILDLYRTHETDSTNLWGSIEPRLRTTDIELTMKDVSYLNIILMDYGSKHSNMLMIKSGVIVPLDKVKVLH